MAVSPFVGGAGLAVASALILLERTGKAVRSPAKTALLAHVAQAVGRGRGFGVHKAMDQTGAFIGPLLVAGVIALTGALWAGLAVLAVPGVIAMVVLVATRVRVPDPAAYDTTPGPAREPSRPAPPPRGWLAEASGAGLPPAFFWYAASASLMTGGLVTFGLIGYHLTVSHLASESLVPVLYAGGMLAEAVGALVVGWLYDRVGPRVLYAVPVLVAVVPGLAMSTRLGLALGGIVVWGLAFGLQDSTIKALVAEVVEAPRRATAYGVFAAIQGAGGPRWRTPGGLALRALSRLARRRCGGGPGPRPGPARHLVPLGHPAPGRGVRAARGRTRALTQPSHGAPSSLHVCRGSSWSSNR